MPAALRYLRMVTLLPSAPCKGTLGATEAVCVFDVFVCVCVCVCVRERETETGRESVCVGVYLRMVLSVYCPARLDLLK